MRATSGLRAGTMVTRLARIGVADELGARVAEAVGAAEGAHGQEGHAHGAGLETQGHHHVAVLEDLDPPLLHVTVDGLPKEEEATVHLAGAAPCDEEVHRHPRELAGHPEVLLLLTDDLADEGAGAALEVVAVVDQVVPVLDEPGDGLLRGHELADQRPRLVVADPFPVAVGVGQAELAGALVEDFDVGRAGGHGYPPGVTPSAVGGTAGLLETATGPATPQIQAL